MRCLSRPLRLIQLCWIIHLSQRERQVFSPVTLALPLGELSATTDKKSMTERVWNCIKLLVWPLPKTQKVQSFYFPLIFSQNLISIIATSARVALPAGLNAPSSPLIIPVLTAHCMACCAQSETVAASLKFNSALAAGLPA